MLESGGKPGSTHSNGKDDLGHFIRFTFETGPKAGIIRFSSAGNEERLDLYAATPGEIDLGEPYIQFPRLRI